jgi:hypothetical protein
MPNSGRRKVLNAAATRAGLAIQSMSSASRGKRPPNNANKQPTLVTSCLALLRQLQRGCFVRVADQAALAAGGWRSSQRPFDPVSRLLPPYMTPPEHKPQHGNGSSPWDAYPLGDFPALDGEEHSLARRIAQSQG